MRTERINVICKICTCTAHLGTVISVQADIWGMCGEHGLRARLYWVCGKVSGVGNCGVHRG